MRCRALDRACELFALSDTKSSLIDAQNLEYAIIEPGSVAELECGAYPAVHFTQEIGEQLIIARKIGRKLKQHRAKPISQGPRDFDKIVKRFLGIAKASEMSNSLRGLQGEPKIRRRLIDPSCERRRIGHAAESVIDLDCRHPLGVVGQHLCARKLRRIKMA